MEYSKNGKFIDAPSMFAINRDAGFTGFKTEHRGGATIIDTGKIKVEYTPDGKPFGESNLKAEVLMGDSFVGWSPGMKNNGNLGGTIRTVDGVFGPVDLGEGLISRDGWYVIDDSTRHLYTADWVESRPNDAGTDWYFFGYGYDLKNALKSMTVIGGKVPLPRKYALGAWYSRYWPYSSKEYRQIVKEYDKNDFPLDIMVMDMDWHKDGWTGWSWNRKLLPDAEELLKWFHSQGLAVTLNVHPADGIGPHEDMYADFMRDMGKDPAKGEWLSYDAGDKKYLDTLFKYTHAPKEKEGVDFWWLDWQQYPFTRSIPDLTNLAWLNNYYYSFTSRNGLRGQSFSRWPGWGDHRHPIHFSGDSHTGWPMLAFEIPFTSTAGNMGTFYWSHDIGGHMGSRNEESYTRWVQFGATSAALRSHSTRSPELDRRPWKYAKWAGKSMRISFHLRSEIFPYIYSSAYQCYRDSIPLNRAMYMEFPKKEEAYHNAQQYFFGDILLAAPVVTPGIGPNRVGSQIIWLPKGAWFNYFTGEKFTGEGEIITAADINEFPLFVKAGAPLPLQPYTHRMATTPLKTLVIRTFPGEEGKKGSFTLYEDDGMTNGYTKGAFATTELGYVLKNNIATVSIAAAKGKFPGQVSKRAYIVELPATLKASRATIDGKPANVKYDAAKFTNTVSVAARSIGAATVVKVWAKPASAAELSKPAIARRLKGAVKDLSPGASLKKAIAAAANTPESEIASENKTLNILLAIGGAALIRKNEAPYLYNGAEKLHFLARPGLLDGDAFTYSVTDRVGTSETIVYKKEYAIKQAIDVTVPQLGELPAPPAFGVAPVRFVSVVFSIDGRKFTLTKTIDRKPTYLTKWNIIGLFDFDTQKKFGLQTYGPEENEVDLSAIFPGFGGQNVNWRRVKTEDNKAVDLKKAFYIPSDNKLAYAVTFVDSDSEQKATLNIQSDDGSAAWVNGKKVFERDESKAISSEPDDAKITLKPGRNAILLKVSQFRGDWGFRVSIETEKPVSETYGRK